MIDALIYRFSVNHFLKNTSKIIFYSFVILQMKSAISHSMSRIDSSLRILFATEAYGMGTDAPDVRNIVHVGPPNGVKSK